MKLLCEAGLMSSRSIPARVPIPPSTTACIASLTIEIPRPGKSAESGRRAHQEHYSVEEGEYTEGPSFRARRRLLQRSRHRLYWKRCKGTGGKANFWGRSSARYGDIDFKAASLDGFAKIGR